MFYTKGTPRAIVDKLNSEIKKALDTPEMKAFMPREALDPVASTPEQLTVLLRQEIDKYAKVIRLAGIKVE
jgi:tripartite-type tricarboxylate transporter receptor subunit TctC